MPRAIAARLGLLGTAIAGVVAGHVLAYAVALPNPALRHAVLERTGHAYWQTAVVAAIVLAIVILVARVGRELRGGAPPAAASGPRLAMAQALLFVVLEVAERASVGASVIHFLGDHLLTVGVLTQVAVAFLVAIGVRLLARGIAAIARSARYRRAPRALASPLLAEIARPGRLLAGAAGVRGPPRR